MTPLSFRMNARSSPNAAIASRIASQSNGPGRVARSQKSSSESARGRLTSRSVDRMTRVIARRPITWVSERFDHDSAVIYCYECARPCDDGGAVPMCPSHGPRWKLVRNAPCAEVLLTRGGSEVLLIRRAHEPFQGCWALPGGFVEYGEHPADAARRELLEEVGVPARLTSVLGVYNDPHFDDIAAVMTFVGEAEKTSLQLDAQEVLEARWFSA